MVGNTQLNLMNQTWYLAPAICIFQHMGVNIVSTVQLSNYEIALQYPDPVLTLPATRKKSPFSNF